MKYSKSSASVPATAAARPPATAGPIDRQCSPLKEYALCARDSARRPPQNRRPRQKSAGANIHRARESAKSTLHRVQIILVELIQQAFLVGIRPRCVGTRFNAKLRELAHMPILTVRHIPEIHGVACVEAGLCHGLGIEQPAARDLRSVDAHWPHKMSHDIIGMQAQQERWEDGVVIDVI